MPLDLERWETGVTQRGLADKLGAVAFVLQRFGRRAEAARAFMAPRRRARAWRPAACTTCTVQGSPDLAAANEYHVPYAFENESLGLGEQASITLLSVSQDT
mmetsp:Transcript_8153/g.19516  ORF Transcript_8153/g.19516 Transcript_8153/m.19516 type:complete len:102 (-) Transcript_8153:370-675(-)